MQFEDLQTAVLKALRAWSNLADTAEDSLAPTHLTNLFGNQNHVDNLMGYLTQRKSPGVIAIVGIGGIGKTALALKLVVGLTAVLPLQQILTDLPTVLAAVSPSAVLLTSRRRQDAPERFHDLSPFTPADAFRLLNAWSPDQIDNQTAAERICELVGNLPLAVRLVGRYLYVTGETADGYLVWLEETPLQALAPDGVQRRQASIPRLLAHSLEQVGLFSQKR